VLAVADFITAEMDKIQNGDTPDGDPKELVAEIDKFLSSIKGDKKEKEVVIKQNVHEEPKQFYIAPMATSASRFYKIYIRTIRKSN
jgi:two-component system chemotaxis sensor kinase CheA